MFVGYGWWVVGWGTAAVAFAGYGLCAGSAGRAVRAGRDPARPRYRADRELCAAVARVRYPVPVAAVIDGPRSRDVAWLRLPAAVTFVGYGSRRLGCLWATAGGSWGGARRPWRPRATAYAWMARAARAVPSAPAVIPHGRDTRADREFCAGRSSGALSGASIAVSDGPRSRDLAWLRLAAAGMFVATAGGSWGTAAVASARTMACAWVALVARAVPSARAVIPRGRDTRVDGEFCAGRSSGVLSGAGSRRQRRLAVS
jgi:hypothetical protein